MTFHPAGPETITQASREAGQDGPAASAVIEVELSPDQNPHPHHAEGEPEDLRGPKSLPQPGGRDDGAEEGHG